MALPFVAVGAALTAEATDSMNVRNSNLLIRRNTFSPLRTGTPEAIAAISLIASTNGDSVLHLEAILGRFLPAKSFVIIAFAFAESR